MLDSLIITLHDFRVFVYYVVGVYTVCSKRISTDAHSRRIKDNKIRHQFYAAAHDIVYTQLLTQSLLLSLKFHLAKGISQEPQVDDNGGQ